MLCLGHGAQGDSLQCVNDQVAAVQAALQSDPAQCGASRPPPPAAGPASPSDVFSYTSPQTAIRPTGLGGVGVVTLSALPAGTIVSVEKAAFAEPAAPDYVHRLLARLATTQPLLNTSVLRLLELHPDPKILNEDMYASTDFAPELDPGRWGRAALLRLLAVTTVNPFASTENQALLFALHGARFNHACVCNAAVVTVGTSVLIHTTRDLPAGAEVLVQYVSVGDPPRTDFRCQCLLCLNDASRWPVPAALRPLGEASPAAVVAHVLRFLSLLESPVWQNRAGGAAVTTALLREHHV